MTITKTLSGALVAALLLLGFVVAVMGQTAVAAPAPSITVSVVCDRGVQPTWDGSLRGFYVEAFDALGNPLYYYPDPTAGSFECPASGGRQRAKLTFVSGSPVSVTVRCWNGTIQSGSWSGPLPFKGDCHDNALGGLHYASFSVR